MTHHKNITYRVTPYPAPTSCYRKSPNGELPYYTVASVKHAEKLHKLGKKAVQSAEIAKAPVALNGWNRGVWRSPDGDKICVQCGRGFEGIRPNQLTCSSTCSRERKNSMSRASGRARKDVA